MFGYLGSVLSWASDDNWVYAHILDHCFYFVVDASCPYFFCVSFKNCFFVLTGAIILIPAFYFFDLHTVIQSDSNRSMHIQFILHTAVCKFLLCYFLEVFEIAFIAWKLICEL